MSRSFVSKDLEFGMIKLGIFEFWPPLFCRMNYSCFLFKLPMHTNATE